MIHIRWELPRVAEIRNRRQRMRLLLLIDMPTCSECGASCQIIDGVSFHMADDEFDYDTDADHVAVPVSVWDDTGNFNDFDDDVEDDYPESSDPGFDEQMRQLR